MIKPKLQRHPEYLNYFDCVQWIEEKYKCDLRNFTSHKIIENDYQDFWQFILKMCDVYNGAFIWMYRDWKETCKPWEAEIIDIFFAEFGEFTFEQNDALHFLVAW
ncbi:hypothetical protein CMI47_13120 [Candidatus Pacearchaeota archaeon]|nr:hypothetical protein [Candidatus Pacearchaeota archaeon]|tara:strand:+ start:707 stop:1021 length:315 start_codon:yes stop_codon:yes gene_type:complete